MLSKEIEDARASRKIVGAPSKSKKAKLALVLGLMGFGLAFATGCDETFLLDPSDPEEQDIMYSGCHAVITGETCELKDSQGENLPELSLVVNSSELPKVHLETSEGIIDVFNESICEGKSCSPTNNGFRFTFSIPENADQIVVTSNDSNHQPWDLALIPYRDRPEILTQAQAIKAESGTADALGYLEKNLSNLPKSWKAEALSTLARFHKRLGNGKEALSYLGQSRELHKSDGNLSMFIKDATVTVHTLLIDAGMQLNAARKMAESMQGTLAQHYESQHFLHWASLFAANKARDHRTALFHAKRGTLLAQNFGNTRNENYFTSDHSHTLQKLNRAEEAIALLKLKASTIDHDKPSCKNAELLNTLGFVQWNLRQALKGQKSILPDALSTIKQAQTIASKVCTEGNNKHEQINTLINLALVQLDLGQLEQAQKALDQIPTEDKLKKFHKEWMTQTQAEIYLASKKLSEALNTFKKLEQMSGSTIQPYLQVRALNGQASAYAMLGKTEKAHLLWESVANTVDAESLLVPIHEGRELFIAHNQESTSHYVRSLLRAGKAQDALNVIHKARTQMLRSLQWQEKLNSLTETERSKWLIALGNYQNLRQDLTTLKQNKWQLAQNEITQSQKRETELTQKTSEALDNAISVLGSTPDMKQAYVAPRPGHVRLTYFQAQNQWIALLETNETAQVSYIQSEIDWTSPKAIAQAFLTPFSTTLMEAKRIHVQPWGRLQTIDIHSLPVNNRPLISYAPVVYPLGFASTQQAHNEQRRALIVADPSGNLPKAREEAKIVRQHLGEQYENQLYNLNGVDATVEKLRTQLTQVEMFHYAGHGKFNTTNNTNSSLMLANESKFKVSDILALPRVPESVILSACETAKTNTTTPQEGLGIAQAFITAGSQTVVASTRSVEDSLSQFIMTHLYKSHASTGDLALALQQAQTKAALQYPESDWATFRIITKN